MVLATSVRYRRLDVAGMDRQAALFLARNAADVNLVIRHHNLNRDRSRYLAERIASAPLVRGWRKCEVASCWATSARGLRGRG